MVIGDFTPNRTQLNMTSLDQDTLSFTFPEISPQVCTLVETHLTQILPGFLPDDGKIYPLPAGLDRFPLRSVDDFADTVSETWMKQGGVMMPMYQSEALWIGFSSRAFPI